MITRRSLRPSSISAASSWVCPRCTQTSRAILPRSSSSSSSINSSSSNSSRLHLLPTSRGFASTARREVTMPDIAYNESFREVGVPGLLSAQGYALAWTQYQGMMIRKVNELTAGEALEQAKVKDLVLQFARDPMAASLFNHASMAWNNYFFFSTLSTAPAPLARAPALQDSLVHAFGSVDALRATMLDTADAMFGPGFVWLVWARNVDAGSGGIGGGGGSGGATRPAGMRSGSWKVLSTYLAGTPYPEAGYRQQGLDMNTNNVASFQSYLDGQPVNTAGAFGPYSESGRQQAKLPPGGTNLMPVLCVNTWEHVWIYDYGLGGKRKFLSDWWDAVDWAAVEQYMPNEARNFPRVQPY